MLYQRAHNDVVEGAVAIGVGFEFEIVLFVSGVNAGAEPAVDEVTLAQDGAHGFELGRGQQVGNCY